MDNLELNKIVASVLVAGIVAMFAGNIADILYKPNLQPKEMGYIIDTGVAVAAGSVKEEIKFEVGKLMASASYENGEKISKKCTACHVFNKGGENRVGPALHGILGADKGKIAGYSYSNALKDMGGKWDYEAMFKFLYKPKDYVKGTKMGFAGLKKPEDIADMVEFLRQNADSQMPLPPVEAE